MKTNVRNLLTSFAAPAFLPLFANAQYTVEVLPQFKPGYSASVLAAGNGQQVGSSAGHAAFWTGARDSFIDLDPGLYGSCATSIFGGNQAGYYGAKRVAANRTSHTYYHAILWLARKDKYIDLNPVGDSYGESRVFAYSGGHQYGVCNGQPAMWTNSATSLILLTPSGALSGQILGADGTEQVGSISTSAVYGGEAEMWTGTAASAVSLEPPNLPYISAASGVDAAHNEQAGYVTESTGAEHAAIWHGTAASFVDLNPANSLYSAAVATRGGYEIGYAIFPGPMREAVVWRGTAASYLNLGSFLPAGYSGAVATGFDSDGSIVGYAYGPNGQQGVIWRQATPVASAVQSPVSNGPEWITQSVQLSLSSPYNAGSITYEIGGSTPVNVAGTTANLTLAGQGTNLVYYYASDGKGDRTPTRLVTANIDSTPPSTKATYSNFTFSLAAYDAESGVAKTYYTVDGGAQNIYSGSLTVTNTPHVFTYWSTDKAGNIESAHTLYTLASSPILSSISPTQVLTGWPNGLTISLSGNGFISGSQVNWNGSAIPTTFVSAKSLTAVVPAAALNTPGSFSVTVTNAAPGTGTSAAKALVVYQQADASGGATNIGDTGYGDLDISPVSSSSGFTLTGQTIHVATNATSTTFLDANGNSIGQTTFMDTVGDGQTISVIGTYSNGTITAWTIQLH